MTAAPVPTVTVELVDHPLFDDSVVTPDQALLDAMAAEYVATLDGTTPEMERFLFGSAPVQVFDRIFAGDRLYKIAVIGGGYFRLAPRRILSVFDRIARDRSVIIGCHLLPIGCDE